MSNFQLKYFRETRKQEKCLFTIERHFQNLFIFQAWKREVGYFQVFLSVGKWTVYNI